MQRRTGRCNRYVFNGLRGSRSPDAHPRVLETGRRAGTQGPPSEGFPAMSVPVQRDPSGLTHPADNRQVYDQAAGHNGIVLHVLGEEITLGPVDGGGAPWVTDMKNVSLLFPLDAYPAELL